MRIAILSKNAEKVEEFLLTVLKLNNAIGNIYAYSIGYKAGVVKLKNGVTFEWIRHGREENKIDAVIIGKDLEETDIYFKHFKPIFKAFWEDIIRF